MPTMPANTHIQSLADRLVEELEALAAELAEGDIGAADYTTRRYAICLDVAERIDTLDRRAAAAEETLAKYGLLPGMIPTLDQVRKLGALQVDSERAVNADAFLAEQRRRYAQAHRVDLEEELLRRDKNALLEGRQLTDGRMAGRLLRELLRGMLQLADAAELRQLDAGLRTNPKGMSVDKILGLLGAEPADRRLLAESGTTLGGGGSAESRTETFEKLASGELAHTADTPVPSVKVADQVREFQTKVKPKVVGGVMAPDGQDHE